MVDHDSQIRPRFIDDKDTEYKKTGTLFHVTITGTKSLSAFFSFSHFCQMSSSTGRGSSEYLHTLVGAQPSSILNYHFFVYLHSLRDTSHAMILLPVRPNECPLSCQELLQISTLQKLHVQKKVSSPAFLLGSGALVTYFYKGYFFLD